MASESLQGKYYSLREVPKGNIFTTHTHTHTRVAFYLVQQETDYFAAFYYGTY